MPKFVVSFFSDAKGLQSKLLEADSPEGAVRSFFQKYEGDYTKNDEGFAYFREDFADTDRPMGSVVEIS